MKRSFRPPPKEYDSNRRPSSRSEQSDGEDGRTGLSRGEVDLYLLVDWKQCPLIATEVERAGRAVAGQRNDCYRHATATAGRKLHDADCSRCRLRAGVDGTAHKDVAAGNCRDETGNQKNDKEAIHRAPPTSGCSDSRLIRGGTGVSPVRRARTSAAPSGSLHLRSSAGCHGNRPDPGSCAGCGRTLPLSGGLGSRRNPPAPAVPRRH